MKLLISGMPCCGKTYFGDALRVLHGFTHANLEERRTPHAAIVPPGSSFELPHWLASLADNVVATWGFAPCPGWLDLLNRFIDAGFTPWWFYADADVARACYASREGERKTLDRFDPQMQILKRAQDELETFYGDRMVESLTARGYKSTDEIFATLVDWADRNTAEDAPSAFPATAASLLPRQAVAAPFAPSVA